MTKRYHFHFSALYQIAPGEIMHVSHVLYTDIPPSDDIWYSTVKQLISETFLIDQLDKSRLIVNSLTLLHVEDIE